MAKKKFDKDQVIDSVIALFWQQGFTATSIQQIVEVTGLKPGSIYHEFGSKEALFQLALTRYTDNSIYEMNEVLNTSLDVCEGIRKILSNLVQLANQPEYCGCFLIKSQLELSASNSQVYQYTLASLQKTENNYRNFLSRKFDNEKANCYARQLMMVIFAIRVYGYQDIQNTSLLQTSLELLPWLQTE